MHTAEDFKRLSKQEKNARRKMRYLALYHFRLGKSRYIIAQILGVSRTSVNKWISLYLSEGMEALSDKKPPGRPSSLSSKQKQHLAAFIENHTTNPDGGRLIAEDIRQYIQKQFGVEYQLGNIYRLLKEIGLSWITSRSRHPKQSLASQDVFKKVHTGNAPSHPF